MASLTRETFYSLLWQSTDQRFRETCCAMAGLSRKPCYSSWDDLPSGIRARLRPEVMGLLEAHEVKRQESKAAREREARLAGDGAHFTEIGACVKSP